MSTHVEEPQVTPGSRVRRGRRWARAITSVVLTAAVVEYAVLPQLVHGGPGRAGGGEELGGERGLHFYSQRTAIAGDRPILDAIFGTPQS